MGNGFRIGTKTLQHLNFLEIHFDSNDTIFLTACCWSSRSNVKDFFVLCLQIISHQPYIILTSIISIVKTNLLPIILSNDFVSFRKDIKYAQWLTNCIKSNNIKNRLFKKLYGILMKTNPKLSTNYTVVS